MTYVRQILPIFFLPIGVTLLLIAAGWYFRRRVLFAVAGAILWLSSTPALSGLLIRALERSTARVSVDSTPVSDAIVVLGGGRIATPGPPAIYEWREPDRFYGGVELAKADKAPVLVFVSPASPWSRDAPRVGDILSRYAVAMGVPAQRIRSTRPAANTADEAHAVAELLGGLRRSPGESPAAGNGAPRILLVTSAFHMPRARMLFERAGFAVTPFPVEFQHWQNQHLVPLDFFPSADALKQAELAWHELYGRLFYRVFSRSRSGS